ncbi:MAG: phosphoenolpyruvate synthase, partial [Flavobacteriales bacterium]|nr:phosphoenolpyruvate synthase [Flavobacteriales bacterium]
MKNQDRYILPFENINLENLPQVGGKNASLGEMVQNMKQAGIRVPEGFAVTASAFWDFLDHNVIRDRLEEVMGSLDTASFANLQDVGSQARELVLSGEIPPPLDHAIRAAYRQLVGNDTNLSMAVRSSATAEDLPNASFAGQHESYLNVQGEEELLIAYRKCLASLFTDRAIKYRVDNGFGQMDVALSVGVQKMVRSDKGASGVIFTLDPETGFRDVVAISGIWGLGENIVQGTVDPDEFVVFKPSLQQNKKAVISTKLGKKQKTMVYAGKGAGKEITTQNIETSPDKRVQFVLSEKEAEELARWAVRIEDHYGKPMDIEWARDGLTGECFVVQARPETVHAQSRNSYLIRTYRLKKEGTELTRGTGLGNKIASGRARVLKSPAEADKLLEGEVLVTDLTTPDWDPVMKKASAIVTNKGGRTSHAAIVARELGVAAIVGTGDATRVIKDGDEVTVSCTGGQTGIVYAGILPWEEHTVDTREIPLPGIKVMLILADPDKAFGYSFLPNNGVGLMRMEFVINNAIRIHPMALVRFNELEDAGAISKINALTAGYKKKEDYFIEKLSQAVATVAAAFYPKDVIVRMSDFKSNEYANLIGGHPFEPHEENPMIGFRGASRYYSPLYKEGFRLECKAMKVVRDDMGLTNVKLMIPFCRTPEEGKKVVEVMAESGLKRGENGLEIYTMIEIPSNVIVAEKFAEVFDGFSIGSNDLTQLTLGLDRDSALVNALFNENDEAVKRLISQVIRAAKS